MRKLFSRKFLTRIFCIVSVVILLVACAVPAFALGANSNYTNLYSALPFQYMYFNRLGGPFEYPCAQTRRDSYVEVNYDCQSLSGSPDYDLHLSSQADYLDANFFFPYDIYAITLEMRDSLARINDASIQLAAYDGDLIWSIHIYGTYLVPSYSSDGTVTFASYSFDSRFIEQTNKLELKDYLMLTFNNKTRFNFNNQYFKYLCIDIELEPVPNTTINHFEIYNRKSSFSSSAPDVSKWFRDTLGPAPEPSVHLNVGTFLGDSVNSFMTTPIWDDFTFGHLLAISFTIGIVFLVLKMIV